MAEAVVKAIAEYIGVPYKPLNAEEYYVVQKNDTLWGIARKFGITVDDIKNANNLKSNTLSIGQLLYIPTQMEKTSSDTYTVKSGDTLYSIARKYNLSVDELKELNNLTSNTLSIGQVLKISPSMPLNENTYTVKQGDTLYSIANKYGVSVNELKEFNNLTSNTLSINQVLKIPSETKNNKTYIVKSGDTLYQIAKNFNTTVDEIKKLNNLTSNTLSIGQTLIIN